jgi:hypothetical protein
MAAALKASIPLPYGLKFMEWGAFVADALAAYGVAAPLTEADWKSWVQALFYVPELVAAGIPESDPYPDWAGWANRFLETVR